MKNSKKKPPKLNRGLSIMWFFVWIITMIGEVHWTDFLYLLVSVVYFSLFLYEKKKMDKKTRNEIS